MGRRRDCAGKFGCLISLSALSGPTADAVSAPCWCAEDFLSDSLIQAPRNPRDFFRDGSSDFARAWIACCGLWRGW